MQAHDTGIRAAIKNASTIVQETASKSETAALDAVERTEAAFATAQASWNGAKDFGSDVAQTLGQAGRTTFDGVVEYNGAISRYAKDAFTDTIETGRKTMSAKCVREAVDIYVDYMARRGLAVFASISDLNAIAEAKTVAAWSPLGDTLRKVGEMTSVKTKAAA